MAEQTYYIVRYEYLTYSGEWAPGERCVGDRKEADGLVADLHLDNNLRLNPAWRDIRIFVVTEKEVAP